MADREIAQKFNVIEPLRGLLTELEGLTPDPRNARLHSQRNVDAIAASLVKYGQRKPIVVREEGLIVEAGNGTLEAARSLGWTHLAAVIVDDDPSTATGFSLADNRTAELAEWDEEALASLLVEVGDDDAIRDLCWSESEVSEILERVTPEPELPEAPEEDRSTPSDSIIGAVYSLGRHTLHCGDATEHGTAPADVSIVDPPYELAGITWSGFVSDPSVVFGVGSKLAKVIPADMWRWERVIHRPSRARRSPTTGLLYSHSLAAVYAGRDSRVCGALGRKRAACGGADQVSGHFFTQTQ